MVYILRDHLTVVRRHCWGWGLKYKEQTYLEFIAVIKVRDFVDFSPEQQHWRELEVVKFGIYFEVEPTILAA